jgi:hypothetical protein
MQGWTRSQQYARRARALDSVARCAKRTLRRAHLGEGIAALETRTLAPGELMVLRAPHARKLQFLALPMEVVKEFALARQALM